MSKYSKLKSLTLTGILLVSAVFNLQPFVASAQLSIDPSFNPSVLIDDRVFVDTKAFGGPDGIQKFLEQRRSILANTSPDFIAKLKEPNANLLKSALEDPGANLGRVRTAAELIWDAAQSSGLNPQVILVTLNKEQSLIEGHQNSSPERLQRALDFSLGFGCPDNQPCGELYRGFYFQLFGNLDAEGNRYLGMARSLMRSYNTPGGRGPAVNGSISKVGDTITLDNTLGGYDGVMPQQTFVLGNSATAALYRFTPHVFNGNYNFWRFFNSWFRYPSGSLLRQNSDNQLYYIDRGQKFTVPSFVLAARGLSANNAVNVSPTELSAYPLGGQLAPVDNTVVQLNGQTFVFLNNQRRPASSFVMQQRGISAGGGVNATESELALYPQGPTLLPKDGTVLKGDASAAIYVVMQDHLLQHTGLTAKQYDIGKQIQILPQAEVDSYTKSGFVPPKDGTLIKADNSGTVFLIQGGQLRPLTGELFKNLKLSFKNVITVPAAELSGLTTGPMPAPANNTYVLAGDGLFLWQDGAKRKISNFVVKQRKITADITYPVNDVANLPEGVPVLPREATILKGQDSPAVFIVQGRSIRPLTAAAFKRRNIKPSQITVLPQAEVDGYPKGDALTR